AWPAPNRHRGRPAARSDGSGRSSGRSSGDSADAGDTALNNRQIRGNADRRAGVGGTDGWIGGVPPILRRMGHPMARAAVAAWLVLCGLSGAAAAQPAETYSYTIHHPTFGDIGTYTDRVERNGGDMRVETRL